MIIYRKIENMVCENTNIEINDIALLGNFPKN